LVFGFELALRELAQSAPQPDDAHVVLVEMLTLVSVGLHVFHGGPILFEYVKMPRLKPIAV
jgi:hypothetical protein